MLEHSAHQTYSDCQKMLKFINWNSYDTGMIQLITKHDSHVA